ncbi:MAG TPA: 2-oxo acid dehydrogenase subunit E2 [Mycobacterium sp.]|jgi:pyruvate dehydrogenase E2 component (dihydrolipoamide acetyltransferase)|nr:2-oxo acid dehydrogenase subunit E2 [Mycobacterium sp.]
MPTLLRMPGIAADTTSAVLTEWQVHQGVSFAQSDVVATVETDKAQVDIEAEEPGEIVRFLVEPGTRVEVGDAIALQCAPGESIDDPNAAMHALGIVADGDAGVDAPERVFATPLVRRLARAANLDLSTITGTGPNGRIVRRDVEGPRAEHTVAPEPAPAADVAPVTADVVPMAEIPPLQHVPAHTDEPHSRIRLATATRLTDSKRTAPHFYLRGTCRVERLLALRADLNRAGDTKVSVNDLVVKASARAHTLVPAMNVIWTEDATRRFGTVDIAVAVASPRGLVTPVVRDVARRSVSTVAADLADLAARAREGKLHQRDIEGGSFCVSNLGMYGTEEFSAIINPPQSAILAVGAARDEPVVEDGALAVGTLMRVTLSVDHRPIDGSTAAEWMRAFVDVIENPLEILM